MRDYIFIKCHDETSALVICSAPNVRSVCSFSILVPYQQHESQFPWKQRILLLLRLPSFVLWQSMRIYYIDDWYKSYSKLFSSLNIIDTQLRRVSVWDVRFVGFLCLLDLRQCAVCVYFLWIWLSFYNNVFIDYR